MSKVLNIHWSEVFKEEKIHKLIMDEIIKRDRTPRPANYKYEFFITFDILSRVLGKSISETIEYLNTKFDEGLCEYTDNIIGCPGRICYTFNFENRHLIDFYGTV